MVLFNPEAGTVELEAWPRAIGLDASVGQYEGWPITLSPEELTGRGWHYRLPIDDAVSGAAHPGVRIEVRSRENDTLVRIARVLPKSGSGLWNVPSPGMYEVSVFDEDDALKGRFLLEAEPITPDADGELP
jgi:hypothetical protein